ncbi:unnamed protein product [Owenia fusiformis]|uniref:Kinesin-like protein 6 n=1 Tax=Owenia fusiformis TaxID=6347 RepID=A0A8S4PGZ4_OWEFU|nr:unnamed protein product [Owenia fusiformis]
MTSDKLKVAVRIRPLSMREITSRCRIILKLTSESALSITNTETSDEKLFSFDHVFWSVDGFSTNSEGILVPENQEGSPYADQTMVYTDLGKDIVQNAWEGYNSTLFAYGQTGSGKSYSVLGNGPNIGLIPRTYEQLFNEISSNNEVKKKLQVTFTMVEIYNEVMKDLLVPSKTQSAKGLRLRQDPNKGFYIEGLKRIPVQTYGDVKLFLKQGVLHRTTGTTNLNATSSRSHLIVTVNFKQIFPNSRGESTTKTSTVNFVDLAGSERQSKTGALGDRLKEGASINQSLLSLGNVISALAEQAQGNKKIVIPYRESVLTKLLQSALGGNSRTVMLATLSPSENSYEETLSTLRYANRAKRIQTQAVVNENITDKLIRELKEENARLLGQLQKQRRASVVIDYQMSVEENENRMREMKTSWEQQLAKAREAWKQNIEGEKETVLDTNPYIQNVNEDSQLSGVIKYAFLNDETVMGKETGQDLENFIELRGLGIQDRHCLVRKEAGLVSIKPLSHDAKLVINGINISETTTLNHMDRLKLGSNALFLYIGYPGERIQDDQITRYDFNFFQMEMAQGSELGGSILTSSRRLSIQDPATLKVFQEYIDIQPKIHEANALSEEMKKNVKFEAGLKNMSSHDSKGSNPEKEVIVGVSNSLTKKVWVWMKHKFLNRKFLMDELYNKWLDCDLLDPAIQENDPFWDPVEDVFLGSCHIWLQSLGYCIDLDEKQNMLGYTGLQQGVAHVRIIPCRPDGTILKEDDIVILEPNELVGKRVDFMIFIDRVDDVEWIKEETSRGVYCGFTFFKQTKVKTTVAWNETPAKLSFEHHVTIQSVTPEFLDYIENEALVIELWGTQEAENPTTQPVIHTTTPDPKDTSHLSVKGGIEDQIVSEQTESVRDTEADETKLNGPSTLASCSTVQTPEMVAGEASASSLPSEEAVITNSTKEKERDRELSESIKTFLRNMKQIQKKIASAKHHVHTLGGNEELDKYKDEQMNLLDDIQDSLNEHVSVLKGTFKKKPRHSKERKKASTFLQAPPEMQ